MTSYAIAEPGSVRIPVGAQPIHRLMQHIGIQFQDVTLLQSAFTHSSYRNEHRKPGAKDNERLEFLGDAVLELSVSQYLYRTYPDSLEGELTRMRAAIVCEPSLVMFARRLHFSRYLRLGKGEEMSGGRERSSLLADAFEAFVGALYLDQGHHGVERFLTEHFYPFIPTLEDAWKKDYKTMLQEVVQRLQMGELSYEILEERGPAHDREFVIQVNVGQTVFGHGVGRSKKEAEQRAAESALMQDVFRERE